MNARALARNPWAIVGLAVAGGWLIGSGVFALPFSLPKLGHATAPAAPVAPATLPASSQAGAPLSQTSAAMPSPTLGSDPFAGFDV